MENVYECGYLSSQINTGVRKPWTFPRIDVIRSAYSCMIDMTMQQHTHTHTNISYFGGFDFFPPRLSDYNLVNRSRLINISCHMVFLNFRPHINVNGMPSVKVS